MPKSNEPGEVTVTPNPGTPDVASPVSAKELAALDAEYGFTPIDAQNDKPDDEGSDKKPSIPDDQKDPDKKADDPAASKPDDGKKDDDLTKLYANKYKSLKDLEEGSINAQKHIEKIEAENALYLKMMANLPQGDPKVNKTDPPDTKIPLASDILKSTAFVDKLNLIAPTLGEAETKALSDLFGAVLEQSQSQIKGFQDKAHENADVLSDLQAQNIESNFYSKHPNAKEFQKEIDAQLEILNKAAPDPVTLMEYVYAKAVLDDMPSMINAAAEKKLLGMTQTDKDKILAANLISGQDSSGGHKAGGKSEAELQYDREWGITS